MTLFAYREENCMTGDERQKYSCKILQVLEPYYHVFKNLNKHLGHMAHWRPGNVA